MNFEENAREYHKSGCNCAMAVYGAYAEKLGMTVEEALAAAPLPRSEGGYCGAFLAGRKILEKLKPEAVADYEKKFLEIYGDTQCSVLIKMHGFKKNCNNYVGDAARLVEEELN